MDNQACGITGRLLKLELLRRCSLRRLCVCCGLHYGQPPVLQYIINNDGCTQKEIADFLGVTAASIALSTKRLQKSGLITKQADENNLRRNRLSATEKGKEVLEAFTEQNKSFNEKMLSGVTDDEKRQLCALLDKLISGAADGKDIDLCGMIDYK
ncbi:MAG: winged helix-turn-helix transcriptional regulator [Clostridia bacterium]|nr:winged helix-turn-helix transcriptional regulator [Clostridia bacterium]